MARLQAPVVLMARLMLALIFIVESWYKLSNYNSTIQYMEANGVSGRLLPLVIVTELGGGLLVACGFMSRIAACALAGFSLLTALFFHAHFADADQLIHFYKNIAIAGGFLVLTAFGAGDWSIDALRARQRFFPTSAAREAGHQR